MKRTALAVHLPPSRSASLQIVCGRQAVVRHGLFFTIIGKYRRAVYMQLDGKIILADECKCVVDWPEEEPFTIHRSAECPIDEHQILTRREWV